MNPFRAVILASLAFAFPVLSFATTYSLSATFSGTAVDVNGSGHSYEFGGAFSGVFDDAGVPGAGVFLLTVASHSVSFVNPTIGSTTFDATNTGIDLLFADGVLLNFAFGGSSNQSSGLTLGSDDFALYIDPLGLAPSTLNYITTASPGDFAIDFAPLVQFSLTEVKTVPEGTATLTYLAGAFAIAFYARRRAKTANSGTH